MGGGLLDVWVGCAQMKGDGNCRCCDGGAGAGGGGCGCPGVGHGWVPCCDVRFPGRVLLMSYQFFGCAALREEGRRPWWRLASSVRQTHHAQMCESLADTSGDHLSEETSSGQSFCTRVHVSENSFAGLQGIFNLLGEVYGEYSGFWVDEFDEFVVCKRQNRGLRRFEALSVGMQKKSFFF